MKISTESVSDEISPKKKNKNILFFWREKSLPGHQLYKLTTTLGQHIYFFRERESINYTSSQDGGW